MLYEVITILVRVALVVGAVEQGHLDIHHRETREHAIRQRIDNTFSHRRNVLPRNTAALDLV